MAPLAQVLDIGDLIGVVWTSLVAGIGVCLVFSLAIIGFARATDSSREGQTLATLAYSVLALVSLAAVLALVVFGVIVMTSK